MDVKGVDELLQYAIENFLNSRFDKASMYFTMVLVKDEENDIARFGMMCIDAIRDGVDEAQEMFGVYLFSPPAQRVLIREILEGYQSGSFYAAGESDFLHEILAAYDPEDIEYDDAYGLKEKREGDASYSPEFTLAKIYEQLGDYDKAIDYIARAFRMKPFDERLKRELINIVRKKNGKS